MNYQIWHFLKYFVRTKNIKKKSHIGTDFQNLLAIKKVNKENFILDSNLDSVKMLKIPFLSLFLITFSEQIFCHENFDGFLNGSHIENWNLTISKQINLESYGIYHISSCTFMHIFLQRFLEDLSLANNQIDAIEPETFNNLTALKILDLSRNNLVHLEQGWSKKISL